jgi:hypothetical protein
MATRFQFHRLALDANERQTNSRDVEALPVPTLDERVTLYLRAINGNRDFTEEERSNARDVLLNSMAGEIVAQVVPVPDRETNAASNITYEYKGFKIVYGNSSSGRIASIYQGGQLRSWASDLEAAVQWIDESTNGADGGSSLVSQLPKSAPEVTEPRPLQPYDAPTQYRQNVRRKETIRAVPIARRPSVLALTATLGLVLIVAGGTLGHRWTYPHTADEVTKPAQQAGVPPPAVSPPSLSTGTAPDEVKAPAQQAGVPPPAVSPRSLSTGTAPDGVKAPAQQAGVPSSAVSPGTLTTPPWPDSAAPEQHVLRIVSHRSEAEVLAVFRRLQQEQPTLFGQATLKPLRENPLGRATPYVAAPARIDVDRRPQSFTAQIGPFASEQDAAAVCRALEAENIQCIGQPEGR